jgi:hypothetical protein
MTTASFAKGDRVVSILEHTSGGRQLSVGDVGTVTGPCADPNAKDAASRVHCDFANFPNGVNMKHKHLRHAPLVGCFAKGDRVVSMITHTDKLGQTLSKGDVGSVVGKTDPTAAKDASSRVHCSFPTMSSVNMKPSQLRHAPLAGGFSKGDRVVIMVSHKDIKRGDIGTVIGPSVDEKGVHCLICDFPTVLAIRVLHSQLRPAPLTGGFAKGDRVVSEIAFSSGSQMLAKGEIGVVVAVVESNSETDSKESTERVLCDFPNMTGIKMTPAQLTHAPCKQCVATKREITALREMQESGFPQRDSDWTPNLEAMQEQYEEDLNAQRMEALSLQSTLEDRIAQLTAQLSASQQRNDELGDTLAQELASRNALATRSVADVVQGVDVTSLDDSQLRILSSALSGTVARVMSEISCRNECVVCMNQARVIVFFPCKHRMTCVSCSERLELCPLCRAPILDRINPIG